MDYKNKIELFKQLDVQQMRHLFEDGGKSYLKKSYSIEQEIGNYYIDVHFIFTSRSANTELMIDDLQIVDLELWVNDFETTIVTDDELIELERILKLKIKDL